MSLDRLAVRLRSIVGEDGVAEDGAHRYSVAMIVRDRRPLRDFGGWRGRGAHSLTSPRSSARRSRRLAL